ncbi:MAG TPA: hypothetical protein VF454_06555 [Gemmatimonadales bacterium]
MRIRTLLAAALFAGLVGACSSDDFLAKPTEENDTVRLTLGALLSTPLDSVSGYRTSPAGSHPVTLESDPDAEFIYDIDPVLGPAFYPAEAKGLLTHSSTNPGLQRMAVPFDSLLQARSNGYTLDAPLAIDSGDVFLVRSKVRCSIGVPIYSKIQVLGIDSVAHTVTFLIMVNMNCGYRDLDFGLPKN